MKIRTGSFAVITLLCLAALTAKAGYAEVHDGSEIIIDSAVVGDYLAGHYALRNRDSFAASQSFINALDKDPENPVLLEGSYKLMLSVGDVRQAVETAIKYMDNYEMTSFMGVLLSSYEIKRERFQQAEEVLDHVTIEDNVTIESGIDAVITPILRLWVKASEGKYQHAVDEIDNLMAEETLPPTFLNYHNALLADFAGDNESAEKLYEEILASETVMPYHFAKMAGNFYARTGQLQKAEEIYKKYNKQHPDLGFFVNELKNIKEGKTLPVNPLVNSPDKGFAEVLKEAVRVMYAGSFYIEALPYLRLAMFLSEDDETIILLAKYYEIARHYEVAANEYAKIKEGSDFYITAQMAIADNLYIMGEKKKAIKNLRKLSDKYDSSGIIMLNLADMLRKDEKYKDAAKVYTKMLDEIPNPEARNWPIFFARGVCYERAKKWPQAEKDLLKALELKPGQPEVLNYLGYSWIDRHMNLQQAKNMVERAVIARPDDAQIIDSMGWVLFRLKDYDNAAKFLEKAAEITPYDTVINDHLGDTYWQQGRFNEARFQWERALKFKNSDEVSEDTLKTKLKNGLPAISSEG